MYRFPPFPCLRRPLAGEAGRHSAAPFAFSGRQDSPIRPPLRSGPIGEPCRPTPARPPTGAGGAASPGSPGLGPRSLRARSVLRFASARPGASQSALRFASGRLGGPRPALRFAPPGAPGPPAVASRPPAPPIRFVCNLLGICRFLFNFAAINQCLIDLLRFLFRMHKKSGIPGNFHRHLKRKNRHLQNLQNLWELYVTR